MKKRIKGVFAPITTPFVNEEVAMVLLCVCVLTDTAQPRAARRPPAQPAPAAASSSH